MMQISDRMAIYIGMLALFLLLVGEGYAVYCDDESVAQGIAVAKVIPGVVEQNSVDVSTDKKRYEWTKVLNQLEQLPVAEELRATDFYPNPNAAPAPRTVPRSRPRR